MNQRLHSLPLSTKIITCFLLLLWLSTAGVSFVFYLHNNRMQEKERLADIDRITVTLQEKIEKALHQLTRNYLKVATSTSLETVRTLNDDSLVGILSDREAQALAAKTILSRYKNEAADLFVFNGKGVVQVHPDSNLIGMNILGDDPVDRQIKEKDSFFVTSKSKGNRELRPLAVNSVFFAPWDWIISASAFLEDFSRFDGAADVLRDILATPFHNHGFAFVLPVAGRNGVLDALSVEHKNEVAAIQKTVTEQRDGVFRYFFGAGEQQQDRIASFKTIDDYGIIVGYSTDYQSSTVLLVDSYQSFFLPVLIVALVLSLLIVMIGSRLTKPFLAMVHRLHNMVPDGISSGELVTSNEAEILEKTFARLQKFQDEMKDSLAQENKTRQFAETKLQEEVNSNRESYESLLQEIASRKDAFDKLQQEINTRKSAEVYLQLFKSIFDDAIEGILITDADANVLSVNRSFTALTGYHAAEIIGKNPRLLQSGRHTRDFFEDMWRNLLEKGAWSGEIWNRKKNGVIFPEWLSISAIRNEAGKPTHYFAFMHDMTEIKKKEELISFMAYHDTLTNLPNRASLETRLSKAISIARRSKQMLAVIFIDLDNFKNINDSLGHDKGDKLLVSVAQRITVALREGDTLSRLGGDEFIILTENIGSREAIGALANKILECFKKPFDVDSRPIYISGSIGVSVFPDDGSTIQELIKNADIAMYQAKGEGRNKYKMFAQEMNEKLRLHVRIENAIRLSLKKREFVVFYQPKTDVYSEKPTSFEALIRWEMEGRRIGPDQFIPVAEKSSLIDDLSIYVLEEVCKFLGTLKSRDLQVPISVNISPRTFTNADVVEAIEVILKQYQIDHKYIEFEITETTAMTDVEHTIKIMQQFRQRGLNFSIDDFGTGYSSLAYLNVMPVHTLKIDKRFISHGDENSRGIAATIVAIAQQMKLNVVAEGVETAEQLTWLRELGCNEIQGYYYSKPLPSDEAEKYLIDHL